jgi:hypothetical protein
MESHMANGEMEETLNVALRRIMNQNGQGGDLQFDAEEL